MRKLTLLLLPAIIAASAAQAAPLITAAEDTNGEEEGVAFTGQTIEHVDLGTLTVPTFGEDAPAFTDRTHEWNSGDDPLPPALVGGEYVMTANDARDTGDFQLDVTVSSPVTAYLLIDARVDVSGNMPWVADDNWEPLDGLIAGVDEGGDGDVDQVSEVYRKSFDFDGGGTFSTFQQDQGSTNMYGVVVVPEPATLAMLGLGGLAGLIRRKK